MGYIVQSIVFDKDKGWDMKTAREWVKNHKEFSKPIKEEETVNTIRVRLFPPKKAEEMGFTDYRMKTLASGDVGIMLDIAYNKLEGGMVNDDVEYEEEDPIKELKRFNDRLKRIIRNTNRILRQLNELYNDDSISEDDRNNVAQQIQIRKDYIEGLKQEIANNDSDIKYFQIGTGGGTGSSKVAVTNEGDAPNERDIAYEEYSRLFREADKLGDILYDIENKLKRRMAMRKRVLLEAEKKSITTRLEELENEMKGHYHTLTEGGSLASEDLQALLSKSYHSKHPSDYKDFVVDKELSGQRVQVYHNPTTQQTIVAHRGTASAPNWIENVAYAVSNNKSGKAFQHSKKIQDQAYSKYGKENITTIGHSKGALHAQEYGKEGKEVITLNKPVNITDAIFTRVPKSQTDIRTQYDPVSFLRPFQRGNKAVTIKSTTKNPLKEHKTSVLERLDPRRLFGSAKTPPEKKLTVEEEEEDQATISLEEIEQQQLQEQMLQQNRATVNNILGQEINSIVQLFRSQRNDPKSLQEGLVPEFFLEDQIAYANATNLAQDLRASFLSFVTANTDVSNTQRIRNIFRRNFADNLRSILINNNAPRRAGEPNTFVPINEGSGMMCSCCGVNCNCGMMRGGMTGGANNIRISTNETTYVIDLSDKERFYYTALPYVNNTHIRIYPTEEGNISIHEFLDNLNNRDPEWDNYYQRTIVPTIISKMRTTDSTDTYYKLSVFRRNISAWADVLENYIDFAAEREGDYPTAPPTPYESDEDEDEVQNPLQGEGMSGGVSIQFNNGLVEFNTSSPSSFYKSIRAYYFRERPNRRQQYQQAVRDAPNFVRQQEKSIVRDFRNNWNEFLDVLNGDSEIEKRRIVGTTELDIGGIIDAVNDGSVYTESEGALSSDEEGAGMTGGVGEFDIELGNQVERALRDAKRRWAKSPKLFENLEYERRMFNARYGHLMRHIQVHTGMGGMDLRLFRALLNYSEWVKGLEIPNTSYTPVSRGAGKKAKKTGKSKK